MPSFTVCPSFGRAAAFALLALCALASRSSAQQTSLEIASPKPGARVQQLERVPVLVRSPKGVSTRNLSLSVNGSLVQTLSTHAPWTEQRLTWDVGERPPGEYQLRVSAYTGKDRLQSPTIRITVTEAPWYPAPRARPYALVVGVGKYQDTGIPSLSCSCNDARAVYRVLTDPVRGAYPPGNVALMADDSPPERQPTRANILAMLREWLGHAAEGADSVMLYFSGQGVEENGKGYLLPRDARAGRLLDTAEVYALLAQTRAQVCLLVLDAGDGAAGSVRLSSERPLAAGPASAILTSCGRGQASGRWAEKGRSVFTYYLVEGLQGAAYRDRSRGVSLDEAHGYAYDRVKRWATEHKQQQAPRLLADLSGPVVLTGIGPGGTVHAPMPVGAPGPAPAAP